MLQVLLHSAEGWKSGIDAGKMWMMVTSRNEMCATWQNGFSYAMGKHGKLTASAMRAHVEP